jgi:hypothetical protein
MCVNACTNSTHQYTFTNLPSPWRAMTSTTNDHKLHGIHTYHVQSSTACTRASACASERVIKRSLIFERILSKCRGYIEHIPCGYMSYLICVNACPHSVHQYPFTNLPSPWRAMTSVCNGFNVDYVVGYYIIFNQLQDDGGCVCISQQIM